MSNPNLFTVWSPTNEPFETSRANARDLTSHAGWSYKPLDAVEIAAATVPPVKVEEPKVEAVKEEIDAPSEGSNEGAGETASEVTEGEGSTEEEATESEKVEVTEADFAHLEDRDAVVAYLADKFPAFKPHHLSKRDKLVEKLVELTNA